jgi:DNA-binding CsgD family transcriptional regulator
MGRERDRGVPVEVQDIGAFEGVVPGRTAQWVPPTTGFVLVGPAARLICANAEGLRVLAYPEDARDASRPESSFRDRLVGVLGRQDRSLGESISEISSGRRRYRCRMIRVTVPASSAGGSTAVLIERTRVGQPAFRRLFEQFKLTPRERQAVQLLAQGLSNKEMAERMGLSTNTVKTLLRLVMTKLSAPSRSAVICKLFEPS